MPLYQVIWLLKARAELHGIIEYIGRDSPANAEQFSRALIKKTLPLMQSPRLGRRSDVLDGVYELVVHRNYILFYRVLEQTRIVEIVHVKHAAQKL